MQIISCNYTGNIPGVGRGPVVNVKVSDAVYKQLVNLGFNLKLTVKKSAEQPKVALTKALHVPSLEEKRAATLAAAKETAAPTPVKEAKEAPKEVVEETKAPEVVEEPKVEETVATAAPKVFTKDNIDEATDEELEAIIPADVKRPVRYGRKWLLKTAVNYV
jgi:hypothetical protein